MITKGQVDVLAKKFKTNQNTVFREYLQVLFLSKLYSFQKSKKVFFKGGTAIHLIFKGPRFSEDLDFTVNLGEKEFLGLINKVFENMSREGEMTFKERKAIAGKRFLLTAQPSVLPYKVFVNLDFSFREIVLELQKSIIETEYPILFTSYIHHLSKNEIFAEKIRAALTRKKGRDIYDLWFLLTQGASFKNNLVQKKLDYYDKKGIRNEEIVERVESFSKKDFIRDLRPFVPINERNKLGDFFIYVKDYLKKHFK